MGRQLKARFKAEAPFRLFFLHSVTENFYTLPANAPANPLIFGRSGRI